MLLIPCPFDHDGELAAGFVFEMAGKLRKTAAHDFFVTLREFARDAPAARIKASSEFAECGPDAPWRFENHQRFGTRKVRRQELGAGSLGPGQKAQEGKRRYGKARDRQRAEYGRRARYRFHLMAVRCGSGNQACPRIRNQRRSGVRHERN